MKPITIEYFKHHFRFVTKHVWLSSVLIYIALGFLCVCQFQNFLYYNKVYRLTKEYNTIDIERITLCSSREFSGRTATGPYSGTNQIAVSRDLDRYLGWYAIIPNVSKEIFAVTDVTNARFKSTVDIYTYQPVSKAKEFGVKKGKVLFISKQGIQLLGGM